MQQRIRFICWATSCGPVRMSQTVIRTLQLWWVRGGLPPSHSSLKHFGVAVSVTQIHTKDCSCV